MQSFEIDALSAAETKKLAKALESADLTLFADGTAARIPAKAETGILDLLRMLAQGRKVRIIDEDAAGPQQFLTTSQAAAAAGISLTYLRNLTDAGHIPVEYRGTHRRFKAADIAAWAKENKAKKEHLGGKNATSKNESKEKLVEEEPLAKTATKKG